MQAACGNAVRVGWEHRRKLHFQQRELLLGSFRQQIGRVTNLTWPKTPINIT
jgi:hypothetical protein